MISIACRGQRDTIVDDNSLGDETSEGWWKTIHFESHAFVDNRERAKPGDTSLRALFESTKKGVSATLLVAVKLKANFQDEREKQFQTPLPDYIQGTIDFEVCRGYIIQSSVDISPVPYVFPCNRSLRSPVVFLQFVEDDLVHDLAGLCIKAGA